MAEEEFKTVIHDVSNKIKREQIDFDVQLEIENDFSSPNHIAPMTERSAKTDASDPVTSRGMVSGEKI